MWKRLLVAGALLTGALGVWWLGLHQAGEREALRGWILGAGAFGPLVYVALFALLEAVGVPGVVFIALALALWPPAEAFWLIWAGSIGAGCVGFAFARGIGRRFVAAHLPERFRRFDARLATSGLRYVIALRILFYLATPAHWLLGLSGVPFRTVLLGSAIGFLPGAALWAFAGGAFLAWLDDRPLAGGLALGGIVAAILIGRALWRRRRGACINRPKTRPGAHTG